MKKKNYRMGFKVLYRNSPQAITEREKQVNIMYYYFIFTYRFDDMVLSESFFMYLEEQRGYQAPEFAPITDVRIPIKVKACEVYYVGTIRHEVKMDFRNLMSRFSRRFCFCEESECYHNRSKYVCQKRERFGVKYHIGDKSYEELSKASCEFKNREGECTKEEHCEHKLEMPPFETVVEKSACFMVGQLPEEAVWNEMMALNEERRLAELERLKKNIPTLKIVD